MPRLLDIVRKDFLPSREGNAENARRAAMRLLRLAAKSAIARPALLRALGDVDARFVTTNVDEDALLEHLDIIQDAAAASVDANHWFGAPRHTSELSSSVASTSIRLIFGRIDGSRRVLEARPKALRRNYATIEVGLKI